MVFPVVMYGYESWTIKKAEHQRIDALNCGVGEDSWESLGQQGHPPAHPKGNHFWIFIGRTDVEVETPLLWPPDAKSWLIWKAPDAGKDWREEGDDRGWNGWMASLTQWTWVWISFGSWWWTGVLQPMESQRVRHNWATELNWTTQNKCLNPNGGKCCFIETVVCCLVTSVLSTLLQPCGL